MAATVGRRSSVTEPSLPTDNAISTHVPFTYHAYPPVASSSFAQCGSETADTKGLGPECNIARDDSPESRPIPPSRIPLGTPIRAIVPLPRRCGNNNDHNSNSKLDESSGSLKMPVADASRPSVVDCQDYGVMGTGSGEADVCSKMIELDTFQSITATKAHSYVSFEELRLECYAQSMIARGAKPAPVPHGASSWVIIPPIFTPCTVPR
ncbi:hypothetical protein F5I97DRAFT_236539 [Phlebopus sp. FC_14]|nr:hypothetical protein F5I97DRAFT_236539 [Phlebopus sp. FC_14]